jgi:hypothetical protein
MFSPRRQLARVGPTKVPRAEAVWGVVRGRLSDGSSTSWNRPMRIPRLKLQGGLALVAAASVCLWLQGIGVTVLVCGIVVLALMFVSLRNRGRVLGEIKAEEGRGRSLTLAGLVGYSIAIALAFVWVASIWAWQVFEHEADKLRQPIAPRARANP